jgi:hypothetical protein
MMISLKTISLLDPYITSTEMWGLKDLIDTGKVSEAVWIHPDEIENACSEFGTNEYHLEFLEDGTLIALDPSGSNGYITINDWVFSPSTPSI